MMDECLDLCDGLFSFPFVPGSMKVCVPGSRADIAGSTRSVRAGATAMAELICMSDQSTLGVV